MDIVRDVNNAVYNWTLQNLRLTQGNICIPNTLTIAVRVDTNVIAGVIYSAVDRICYISIYAENPIWCTPGILTRIFNMGFAFGKIVKCATDARNNRINRLLKGLGLRREGKLRMARPNGHDEYVWSLTKWEFKKRSWHR